MRSGSTSTKTKDVGFIEAVNDPLTRPEYIRRKSTQMHHMTGPSQFVGRSSGAAVVDRSFCYGRRSIDKEDSIRYALLGPRNLGSLAGTWLALAMSWLLPWTNFPTQIKFPNEPTSAYTACIGRLIFCRYINPAIMCVHFSCS